MLGFYNISLKKLLGKYSAMSVLTSSAIAGTIFLLPSLLMELPLRLEIVDSWGWIHIFYLGLFASALAYLLWNTALTKVSTVTAGAYLYLLPVITAILAFLFLHEIPVGFYVCPVLFVEFCRPPKRYTRNRRFTEWELDIRNAIYRSILCWSTKQSSNRNEGKQRPESLLFFASYFRDFRSDLSVQN